MISSGNFILTSQTKKEGGRRKENNLRAGKYELQDFKFFTQSPQTRLSPSGIVQKE